jgi:hypothetical protein
MRLPVLSGVIEEDANPYISQPVSSSILSLQ